LPRFKKITNFIPMAKLTLKTGTRKTTVSREAVRAALSQAMANTDVSKSERYMSVRKKEDANTPLKTQQGN
jgi:hypothetical protein